jgi:hypothetical protein
MTNKNEYFARKAAALDINSHFYRCGQFTWVTPAPTVLFNIWSCRFDTNINDLNSRNPHFHRNIGVDRHILLPAGVVVVGTNDNSFLFGCVPSLVTNGDARYDDSEELFYKRINRVASLPLFACGAYRGSGSADSAEATLPADAGRGLLVTAITSHGGCWTVLSGGVVPGSNPQRNYIINTLDEINDAHEVRFTSGLEGAQAINRNWFTKIWLGLGSRGDTYGAASPEASWCNLQGIIIPSDW